LRFAFSTSFARRSSKFTSPSLSAMSGLCSARMFVSIALTVTI
jgi:hypothetical protein